VLNVLLQVPSLLQAVMNVLLLVPDVLLQVLNLLLQVLQTAGIDCCGHIDLPSLA